MAKYLISMNHKYNFLDKWSRGFIEYVMFKRQCGCFGVKVDQAKSHKLKISAIYAKAGVGDRSC